MFFSQQLAEALLHGARHHAPYRPSARTLLSLWFSIILVASFICCLAIFQLQAGLDTGTPGRRSRAAGGNWRSVRVEPFEEFLERTGACDRTDGGLGNATTLSPAARQFCERFLAEREKFYRLRAERVNRVEETLRIRGENVCNSETVMVVIVHSLHSYRDRRKAIRATWGDAAKQGTWPHLNGSVLPRVGVAFIFGVHTDPAEERLLLGESAEHGDVIQGEFGESYQNMTLKSLAGLRWTVDHCPSARYLFKCDDDMFINVPAIFSVLEAINMTRAMLGPLNIGSRVLRRGKWRLPRDQFPFAFFPPYESGSGYAISADLLRPLLAAAERVPPIFIDDVYITGILGKILDVRHVRRRGFAYWTSKAPKACDILKGEVLTGTRVSYLVQHRLWHDLINRVGCADTENAVLPGAEELSS